MFLTKFDGVTFQNQTVYISGQAFVRCRFVACVLVLREAVYHMEGCTFERCNWHIDRMLLWGQPDSLRELKALINLVEQNQIQHLKVANADSNVAPPGAAAVPARTGV
jgi:hypothetical protein